MVECSSMYSDYGALLLFVQDNVPFRPYLMDITLASMFVTHYPGNCKAHNSTPFQLSSRPIRYGSSKVFSNRNGFDSKPTASLLWPWTCDDVQACAMGFRSQMFNCSVRSIAYIGANGQGQNTGFGGLVPVSRTELALSNLLYSLATLQLFIP